MHPVNILADLGAARSGRPMGNLTPYVPPVRRTMADLERWFSTAEGGDALEYYRGFLAMDRGVGSRLGVEPGQELERVAASLMAMAEAGQVHLVQRRNDPGDYTYIVAISCHGARHGPSRSARGRQ